MGIGLIIINSEQFARSLVSHAPGTAVGGGSTGGRRAAERAPLPGSLRSATGLAAAGATPLRSLSAPTPRRPQPRHPSPGGKFRSSCRHGSRPEPHAAAGTSPSPAPRGQRGSAAAKVTAGPGGPPLLPAIKWLVKEMQVSGPSGGGCLRRARRSAPLGPASPGPPAGSRRCRARRAGGCRAPGKCRSSAPHALSHTRPAVPPPTQPLLAPSLLPLLALSLPPCLPPSVSLALSQLASSERVAGSFPLPKQPHSPPSPSRPANFRVQKPRESLPPSSAPNYW